MVFDQEVIFVVSHLIWQDASVLPASVSYDHKDHPSLVAFYDN